MDFAEDLEIAVPKWLSKLLGGRILSSKKDYGAVSVSGLSVQMGSALMIFYLGISIDGKPLLRSIPLSLLSQLSIMFTPIWVLILGRLFYLVRNK